MRLKTIWTIPSMSTIERFRRTKEWSMMKIASRLPKRIKYWATIQEIAEATVESPNVMAVSLDELLVKLDKTQ